MSTVLPPTFTKSLQGIAGYDEEAFIAVHQQSEPLTSIRLNPQKPSAAVAQLPVLATIPWCEEGRYLSERPSFTLDPVFHGGAYYVQEASSMFLDYVVKQIYKDKNQPKHVLDLCAAPGGKSTLLAAALPDSFIVSNEVIKTRVGIIAENISKWGSDNVIVTHNDPKDFSRLPAFFDLMVIDAPCSGSGLFRKDAAAVDEWSEANVQMCSHRQQRILTDTIVALQQNGHLIYSTCSYSREEDEEICDWMIDNFNLKPVKIEIDPSWGIVEAFSEKRSAPAYRFYPDKVKGEGFFIACFQHTHGSVDYVGSKYKMQIASKKVQAMVSPFLKNSEEYILSDEREFVIASLKRWSDEIAGLLKILNVRKSGVAIGSIKGKDLIPHHELALSNMLSADIAFVDLDKTQALQYLRRQDLFINNDKKGWTICRYEDINIGWIKVLPNRVNNYYPTNWRILKP